MKISTLLKRKIIGTPIENLSRRIYIRLDPSQSGIYDRQTVRIIQRSLKKNSNCVDIGAHRGSILSEMVACAPSGHHFAFEPLPEHAHYLEKRFPQVKIYQLALCDKRGLASFTRVSNQPTRSGFINTVGDETTEIIHVKIDQLDNVIPADFPIQLIKIDVEGAEYQVLRGGIQTIKKNSPLLIFEHSTISEEVYGASSESVFDLLFQDCGLKISTLESWLNGTPPLSRTQFVEQVHRFKNFYFIAHP